MATKTQENMNPIRVRTLELLWHWREREEEAVRFGLQSMTVEGVVSIDYSRQGDRIVTAGGDNHIRLWELNVPSIEQWLANSQSDMENCVRFICGSRTVWTPLTARWSPNGLLIASGHCDGKICIWWKEKRSEGEDEEWKDYRHLSGHVIDVHDVAFSPDCRYLLSAGGDGSVVLHDLEGSTAPVLQLQEAHTKFCRGVVWDPWMHYVVSFGGGPSLYVMQMPKLGAKRMQFVSQRKMPGDFVGELGTPTFRRMGWSPDGAILAVPYGKVPYSCKNTVGDGGGVDPTPKSDDHWKDSMVHCVYLYTRNAFDKIAARLIVRGDSEIRGVQWSPCFMEPIVKDSLRGDEEGEDELQKECGPVIRSAVGSQGRPAQMEGRSWGPSDYRMALAVWTADAVIVYTTDSESRHSDYTDLHMRTIYDVSWSSDGRYLYTASLDGYVTVISTGGSLGVAHRLPVFSQKPETILLCQMLANLWSEGEKAKLGGGMGQGASASGARSRPGGSDGAAVMHASVRKKAKVEKQQVEPPAEPSPQVISLVELSSIMGDMSN
uniref:Putative chromatin assembly factor 1 subunit B n=1 Tax=Trypanosoma congolense (strain IL3000) TaxID=1068625 RepID=G0UWR5_TRYCI|nr:putative chromatin assembly factor 1 subunit B [Trypanosoma congolense IL3000]